MVLGFDGMRQYNEGTRMCQGVVGPYPFLFHSQICTYTENMKFLVETVVFLREIPIVFLKKVKHIIFCPELKMLISHLPFDQFTFFSFLNISECEPASILFG